MIHTTLPTNHPANTAYFMPLPHKELPQIDKDWTLFLDRDGVINQDVVADYIKSWSAFQFMPGTLEAIAQLSILFDRIFVVTNQAGVGKKLMTLDDLEEIHTNMTHEIVANEGRIDKIYYCTETDNKHINRKPNPGMALQAKQDFPAVDFSKSIMVGNMPNDMWFGRKIGAFTVYLPTRPEENPDPSTVDAQYKDLLAFTTALRRNA
jgi:histidinol-phosphate phosphatase family protein